METFKYIAFVDIDGVFNHFKHEDMFKFIDESVEVLNMLYEKYEIEIVLSSSWRHAFTFRFMQDLFAKNGVKAPLIDRTYIVINKSKEVEYFSLEDLENKEFHDSLCSRDDEIYQWLLMYKPKHFVILDDFIIKHPKIKDYQIITNFWGIKEEDMALRIKHIPLIEDILKKEVNID